jgi:hypothetical protein
MESIFLLLAYLALGRVPSLEQLRDHSPGEWGKLLGLDRIPEVKTLRDKIGLLGDDAQRTARWSGDLAKEWMAQDVEAAGVLLIDGHVRVYHGEATKLPRRYISRERLWVREIRSLSENGHQTAILSTDYRSHLSRCAASMFARWNQENFFKYMRQHYGLDRLVEYGTSPLPETTLLVNPGWRALDSQVRRSAAQLSRAQAAFAAQHPPGTGKRARESITSRRKERCGPSCSGACKE